MLVALVAIQVAAGSIFFFEWLSPVGYDMKVRNGKKVDFDFFRLTKLWKQLEDFNCMY